MENRQNFRKIGMIAGVFFLAWGAFRYFLPIAAPFLLGWFFASAAEPVTRIFCRRGRLGRGIAAAVSVTLVLVFLAGAIWLLAALC